MMTYMSKLKTLYHPVVALIASILAAALFALGIILTFRGPERQFFLYYFVPIGVPFVAFLFDRAARRKALLIRHWALDVAVLSLSFTRAFVLVPLYSGHALFLTFALLTTRSWVVRGSALLVLMQVAYLKFTWRDATFLGGLALGICASLLFHFWNNRSESLDTN